MRREQLLEQAGVLEQRLVGRFAVNIDDRLAFDETDIVRMQAVIIVEIKDRSDHIASIRPRCCSCGPPIR